MAVTRESEPRAGYYVSTQDRPAFVSEFSADEFDDVFELMRQEQGDGSSETNGNGHKLREPTPHSSRTPEAVAP